MLVDVRSAVPPVKSIDAALPNAAELVKSMGAHLKGTVSRAKDTNAVIKRAGDRVKSGFRVVKSVDGVVRSDPLNPFNIHSHRNLRARRRSRRLRVSAGKTNPQFIIDSVCSSPAAFGRLSHVLVIGQVSHPQVSVHASGLAAGENAVIHLGRAGRGNIFAHAPGLSISPLAIADLKCSQFSFLTHRFTLVAAGRIGSNVQLIYHRKVHVAGEVKNASAIRAGDNFLLALARHDCAAVEFHVATATGMMADADDDVASFVLEQALVFVAGCIIDGGSELATVRFQGGEFRPEIFFARIEIRDFSIGQLFCFRGNLLGGDGFFLRRLALLHQFKLLIFEGNDGLLAAINFILEGAVLFVLLRLQLLCCVFVALLLFRFHIELKLFAVRLDLFHAQLRGFQLRLRTGGAALEFPALGFHVGEFIFDAKNFPVPVLEHEQFFDYVEHVFDLVPRNVSVGRASVNAPKFVGLKLRNSEKKRLNIPEFKSSKLKMNHY
jgi:hypothetical protein